jgi:phage shock protein E
MNKLTLTFLFILGLSIIGNAQTKGYKNVNATEFKTLVEKKKGVVIDLRTPDEIKKGKIKGAQEIDFFASDAEARIDKLDKKKTYYIYCAGGGRSGECAEMMVNKGFKNVVNLEKGFSEWKKLGYEMEIK